MNVESINQQIADFRKRFGEAHLYFAYHAAFPLALTPDLAYRIWTNFQRDEDKNLLRSEKNRILYIPWIAVADLLLSNLCKEVGHELYEMEQPIRNELLKRLRQDNRFGKKRILELAEFIGTYFEQQLHSDDLHIRSFANAQKWATIAYIQPNKIARELAKLLAELLCSQTTQKNRTGIIRVSSLVETIAEPLYDAGLEPFIVYSRNMGKFARGDKAGVKVYVQQLLKEQREIQIADIYLPIPEELKKLTLEQDFNTIGDRSMSYNNQHLLEKAREGFKTLDIAEKYINSALKWLEIWLTDEIFKDYVSQIAYLIESEKWDLLLDSFYQVIPFGKDGRRGLVGIGTNRINLWTIQASAQGHSQYLLNQYGEEAKKRGIVLNYDVRKYTQKGVYNDEIPNPVMNLDCKQLAIAAAEVYAANGINVFMFDGVRSTPELSFTIRHLKAVSGDMFSASHNPPTDNGKKVYDEFGGQLIPPDDQHLVDTVTKDVEEIKILAFEEAMEKGLIEYISADIDEAYFTTVCHVSLSQERDIKILYTPLHGTGITSLYPVLKKLDFNVVLDPKTSNPSGAFENVTFNIPNPEVIESFDAALPEAKKINADILLSTDPDADRIGVMVKHENSYVFLNGNEIGIILTQYGISKYKAKNLLNSDCVVVKTGVTTSLIEKIAQENSIQCIADLLVGFKYVGHEMNKLEKDNKMQNFILGTEESHGFLIGNYARDKDAACAAVWISELAAELKKEKKTLVEYLNEIYAAYGYCDNYLTEIRLLGAEGMEQIALIMDHLRKHNIPSFGEFPVREKIDRWDGEPQPHLSLTDTASRNVLIFNMENISDTQSIKVTVRPSGTEPKVKMYFEVFGKPFDIKNIGDEKGKIVTVREKLEKAFMQYCYKILEVDFPERGFLLFWQLPLEDKLKYFAIEDYIVSLKDLPDKKVRKNKLDALLGFLGVEDPIEKVDKAFRDKYNAGILEYLEL